MIRRNTERRCDLVGMMYRGDVCAVVAQYVHKTILLDVLLNAFVYVLRFYWFGEDVLCLFLCAFMAVCCRISENFLAAGHRTFV